MMLGKIETPIYIIASLYFSIVGLVVVSVGVIFLSYAGIADFITNQERALVTRHCQVYEENNKPSYYNGCVRRALTYYEQNQ